MKPGVYLKLMGDLEQQIHAGQVRRVAESAAKLESIQGRVATAERVVPPYLPRIAPKFVSRPAATVTPNKGKNHG